MKTTTITIAAAAFATFATFATFTAVTGVNVADADANPTHPALRQLQFFPQPNSQPGMGPTGPMEVDPALAGNGNNHGLAPTGNEADAVADATTANANTPQGATSGSATGTTTTGTSAVATPDASGIAPNQPTIMVILPDFLAAHSGWSSFTDDVGETTDKKDTKPAEVKPTSAASVASASSSIMAAVTLAVVGISAFA